MNQSNLQTVFERYRQDPTIVTKSKGWFDAQTAMLGRKIINRNKLFQEQPIVTNIVPGKLYMFFYDPKHKSTLPYYDRFPLVFPWKAVQDGFMGLNMHYLPYFYRVQLMDRLMVYASNKNFDQNTKIKYSWNVIGGMAKFKYAAPCVKHYLKNHVASRFIEVPPSDWHTAMMLPVENFIGSKKTAVWGDSLK